MPILEEKDNTVTLNLTVPFIVWTIFFGLLAIVFKSWTLFWVAAIPAMFMVLFLGFMVAVFVSWWFSGKAITLTNKRTGKKTVIRRR